MTDEVLAALVEQHGKALLRYGYLLTQNTAAAEDLVQDALVRTFIRMRAGTSVDSANAYVRRAMLTIYLDAHRRRSRFLGMRHLVAAPEEHADADTATSVDVRTAVAGLAPQERSAVVLRYYDDLTVPQIAERMLVSDGTVKRYLHNAAVKLQAALTTADAGRSS